jgi:excisionase family DNA binding protein
MTDNLLDIPALAERLGVGQRHIRRLVFEKRIPYIKWGHLIRFDPTEIDCWLEEARQPAVTSPSYPEGTSPVRSDRAHR